MSFHLELKNILEKQFPCLKKLDRNLELQKMTTDYVLELPKSLEDKVKNVVTEFYELAHSPEYLNFVNTIDSEIVNSEVPNRSVLMAYDFHYDPTTEELKLIEVNTNASGYLFVSGIHEALIKGSMTPLISEVMSSFHEDMEMFYGEKVKHITIVDEEIEKQNMYPEFLMYQSLFHEFGHEAFISDYSKLSFSDGKGLLRESGEPAGYIYNRYCDFNLGEERSAELRKAFLNKTNAFSPNPREYLLLADKERLNELTAELENGSKLTDVFKNDLNLDSLQSVLLKSFEIQKFSKDDAWKMRKKYFFKPHRSHGGKSTYKGSSISKKVFERLYEENCLMQEIAAPGKVTRGENEWKYDLRFFVYKNKIQMSAARLYQGQLTNFSEDGGGYCTIAFS